MRMITNYLTESQIRSISDLVKSTIFYFCKKKGVFLRPDEVDILISDIQLKAITSSKGYNQELPFAPWVRRIAKTCLSDYITARDEHQQRYRPVVLVNTHGEQYEMNYPQQECGRAQLADDQVTTKKNLEVIRSILDSLGYVGQAFWLQYLGYNDEEIAKRLGKSNSAIRSRKSYARHTLAKNPQIISLCKEYGIRISA